MAGAFDGKVVIVTGAARGIGAATARAFAAAGARVAALDLRGVGPDLPAAAVHAVDVADRAAVDAAVAAVERDLGGVDVLVNNAGIGHAASLETLADDAWERSLSVNLGGPFNCLRATVPALRRRGGGAVVNVASIAAHRMSYHGGPDYTAAKSGLLGLTRHAAFELAVHDIRVNAVCPGPVLTPLVEESTTAEERAVTAKLVPLGRWIAPEDVAAAILFLAGPGAAMCTGATLDVDGGMMVSNGTPYADYARRRGLVA
ncbi:MAG: SDR family oxidoreductase [Hyphomicrobiales bacterium]|nr:SDR family oxidoreductase [Hyphomicrobiales bacterium]